MSMKTVFIPICLPIFLLIGEAQADPVINNREYKVLLEPSLFVGNEEQVKTQTSKFLMDFNSELKKQGFTTAVAKKFKEGQARNISFYDTPGSCKLKAANYVVRERTQLSNNKREVMVKRRTNTLAQLDGISLTGVYSNASSKVEADIIPGNVVYSVSTKQKIDTEQINSIDSLYKLFPSLKQNFNQSGMLAKVSNLTVLDHSFSEPELMLDGQLFKFDLSLWYVQDVNHPVIVELSYKITESKSNGNLSPTSLKNADRIMNLIAGMNKWAAPKSLMKTAWVYQYQPKFCAIPEKN